MAISLYDVSVSSYLQGLEGVDGFLAKGLTWCQETGTDPETVVDARLFEDMLPFRFQILQVVRHSVGAIEAVKSGSLSFARDHTPHEYGALQQKVAEARAHLAALTREEVDAREGHEVLIDTPGNRRLLTTENFILSFSMPNFHFHAATAYDILRHKGVPVGKRDFMGPLRLKAVLEG